jgi:hypothetical protein
MRQRPSLWLAFLLDICVLFASACSASEVDQGMWDPFSARSAGENGIVVEWSGYTDGYQLGQKAKIELGFENNGQETWHAKYCIQLLDSQDVVATLGQREFVLDPGAAMGTPHYLSFPRDLELDDGAYGLALVVYRPQGPIVNSVAIRIGKTDAVYRPQKSIDSAALAACPPVELPRIN